MHGHARLRDKNQITVPPFVVEKMKLEAGDILEFLLNEQGTVELHPARIVKMGSPEARLEEDAAKKEIESGEYTEIRNADDLRSYVTQVRKGENPGETHVTREKTRDEEAIAELGSPVEFEITLPAEVSGGKNVTIQCKGHVVRAADSDGKENLKVYRVQRHGEIVKDRR